MSENHENESRVNEDDSDFEDFGGFEAAEPVLPNVAQVAPSGIEAGPSPWAFLGAGSTSVGVRPDLLCGQNRFPPLLDPTVPAVPNGTESGPDEVTTGQPAAADGGAAFQANFDANFPDVSATDARHPADAEIDDATFANDILDGSFRSTTSSHSGASSVAFGNHQGNVSVVTQSGAVSAKRLDDTEQQPQEQVVQEVLNKSLEHAGNRAESELSNSAITSAPSGGMPSTGGLKVIEVDNLKSVDSSGSASLSSLAAGGTLNAQNVHSNTESPLLKDTESTRYANLASVAGTSTTAPGSGGAPKYAMEIHPDVAKEFAAARKESQEALSVVVEEYKALMKASQLELQEASKLSIQQIVQDQKAHLQLQKQQQEAELEASMKEKKREMEEELQLMMKEQIQTQKEEFEKFILEEKEKNQKLVEDSLREEQESSQRKLEEAVEAERENTKKLLVEQKEQFDVLMKEERAKFAEETKLVLDSERKLFNDTLHKAVEEERERNKEALEKVMVVAKDEMQSHLQQQKQLDKAVRQRQMTSLDIFLESARKQLSLLMEENAAVETAQQEKEENS